MPVAMSVLLSLCMNGPSELVVDGLTMAAG
jgi:hypothetical protein